MAKPQKKPDLRSGLPGHEGTVAIKKGPLAVEDPNHIGSTVATREESEPDLMRPEVGKNVPSGQTTKG
jgi:hypothetical protein